MWNFDCVVISDLHLGARNCRADAILHFLDSIECDRLILAGDVFDDRHARGLAERHIQVLQSLRDHAMYARVDWLLGNHDPSREWSEALLGIQWLDETVVQAGDRQYLVYHGHAWDPALRLPRVLLCAADSIYSTCQLVDPSHRLARWLKRKSKQFARSIEAGIRTAMAQARVRGVNGVICGHSHHARSLLVDGIHYVNTGCWTERPSTFVGIREGNVRLYRWHPPDELSTQSAALHAAESLMSIA